MVNINDIDPHTPLILKILRLYFGSFFNFQYCDLFSDAAKIPIGNTSAAQTPSEIPAPTSA